MHNFSVGVLLKGILNLIKRPNPYSDIRYGRNPVKNRKLLVRVCLHGLQLETAVGGLKTANLAKSFLRYPLFPQNPQLPLDIL